MMTEHYEEPTYAVFGDVHGHMTQLLKALQNLGFDVTTSTIPKNLTIVQVGDLIHKGPFTNELVELVDKIMAVNNSSSEHGTWIQLMGNHESQYFRDCPRFWKLECSIESIRIMNKWLRTGDLRFHYAIEQNDGKPYLLSHAGVNPFWYYESELFFTAGAKGIETSSLDYQQVRDSQTMAQFTRWMTMLRDAPAVAAMPGAMLTGRFNSQAGMVWAESVSEVYEHWRGIGVPFHQVHGHVTPFDWSRKKFYPNLAGIKQNDFVLDKKKRHSLWMNVDGTKFYGIDQGYGKRADTSIMRPLVLTADGVINSDSL